MLTGKSPENPSAAESARILGKAVRVLWPYPDELSDEDLAAAWRSLAALADEFAVLVRQRRYPPSRYDGSTIEGAYKKVTT